MKNMKEVLQRINENEFEDLGRVGDDVTWLMRESEAEYDVELQEVRGKNEGTVIRGKIEFHFPIDYVVDPELLREEMKKKIADMVETLQNI